MKCQKGQTLVLGLGMIVLMILIMAVAVEASVAFSKWQRLANATDAACLAGLLVVEREESFKSVGKAVREMGAFNATNSNLDMSSSGSGFSVDKWGRNKFSKKAAIRVIGRLRGNTSVLFSRLPTKSLTQYTIRALSTCGDIDLFFKDKDKNIFKLVDE